MKFKLSESKTLKKIEEATYRDVLIHEYRRLLGVETNALDDENWKMLDEITKLQTKVLKKLLKLKDKNEDIGGKIDEASAILRTIVNRIKKLHKKDGYVMMVDDRGKEVSLDIDSLDGQYIYGIDKQYNGVEIDLLDGEYTLLEADGSMNDVPVVTQGSSMKLKLKTDTDDTEYKDAICEKCKKPKSECNCVDIEEVQGNRNVKDKKRAKIIAKAKSKVKCKGNMTPELIPGRKIRFKCTPKDKVRAKKASIAGKKRAKTALGKKAVKVAVKTRAFREK